MVHVCLPFYRECGLRWLIIRQRIRTCENFTHSSSNLHAFHAIYLASDLRMRANDVICMRSRHFPVMGSAWHQGARISEILVYMHIHSCIYIYIHVYIYTWHAHIFTWRPVCTWLFIPGSCGSSCTCMCTCTLYMHITRAVGRQICIITIKNS